MHLTEGSRDKYSKYTVLISLAVFLLALIPRLYYIFFVSGAENASASWYIDTYHHWQIAYLTHEIGLGQGFLRLWDLKGMEYFWGLLHPLVLTTIFSITGSASILLPRLLDTIAGSLAIMLVFLLVRRYFNLQAGFAVAFLLSLNPVGIFTDVSGMVEPLSILMLMAGIYFWPKKPVATGFFWFLASLTRAEHWIFAICLIVALIIFDKKAQDKVLLPVTYFVLILLYLKYLLDKTGNAIYPIYWNFIGNAAGEWQADIPLTAEQITVRYIFIAILLISVPVVIFLLAKKPKLYLFSLLGMGNLIFLSAFIGLTEYLKSYLTRFWFDRIFWLSYMWLGFLVAVALLYFLPKYFKLAGSIVGWILVAGIVVLTQFAWLPVNKYTAGSKQLIEKEMQTGKEIGLLYQGGSVLIPSNDPLFTYSLYKNGIEGKNIRGQMFDPYYYFTADVYRDWPKYRKIVLDWFKKENISLLIFSGEENRYVKLVEMEPARFKKLKNVGGFEVYQVVNP